MNKRYCVRRTCATHRVAGPDYYLLGAARRTLTAVSKLAAAHLGCPTLKSRCLAPFDDDPLPAAAARQASAPCRSRVAFSLLELGCLATAPFTLQVRAREQTGCRPSFCIRPSLMVRLTVRNQSSTYNWPFGTSLEVSAPPRRSRRPRSTGSCPWTRTRRWSGPRSARPTPSTTSPGPARRPRR